jgi:hypothetical protein
MAFSPSPAPKTYKLYYTYQWFSKYLESLKVYSILFDVIKLSMDQNELDAILEQHGKWLGKVSGGERADLSRQDLRHLKLRGALLQSARFGGADLRGVDLTGSNMSYADLFVANLDGVEHG